MDGIVFRTNDPGRWGSPGGTGTGGNLTPLQFDENNWALLTRIQALENDPPVAISYDHSTVIGSQWMIYLTNGDTDGPFDLPIATFRDVGEWTNDLPLLKLDLFTVLHRGYFRTNIAHTTPASPAEFDPDATDEDSGSPTFGEKLYTQVFGEDIYIYDIGFFMPGTPGVGILTTDEMFAHLLERDTSLPIDAEGSLIRIKDACTADISMSVRKDGVEIGLAKIDAGETDGYFEIADETEFPGGTVIAVMPPASADVTARGLKITFKMTRTDF